MNDCVFCKIAAGQIPAAKVFENQHALAFLDIKPVNPGHTLVVPKQHFENFLHQDQATVQELAVAVQKVAKAVMQATGAEGFNLGLNNGTAAGQVVPHVHFHVMPRKVSDGYELWKGREYKPGQMEEIAKKIRDAI